MKTPKLNKNFVRCKGCGKQFSDVIKAYAHTKVCPKVVRSRQ
ncbi:unnamed protein product [marine sediment metagenome]|uniref:C2H2-type domain-containing protein n=1 Tax=marine sediment metagenome TaxID=412755 RepID=X1AXD7_9ZZZZ